MKLWCLDDRGGWGTNLRRAASRHGIPTDTFADRIEHIQPGDCAFMRINQGGARMEMDKALLRHLAAARVNVIPSVEDSEVYEDKLAQSELYAAFMPKTLVLRDAHAADRAVTTLGYPFVSKSRTGSASRNCRMIYSPDQARREIGQAFGGGLEAPHTLGEGVQRGYLIWQEFLPGNSYDYRVCKIGRRSMILRRYNRADVPFASGSGITEPVTALDDETAGVLAFANEFFDSRGTRWCGIDVVRDLHGRWRLLETTIGWSQKAYAECSFFGTSRTGAEMWDLVCDEIKAGVFA